MFLCFYKSLFNSISDILSPNEGRLIAMEHYLSAVETIWDITGKPMFTCKTYMTLIYYKEILEQLLDGHFM